MVQPRAESLHSKEEQSVAYLEVDEEWARSGE